MWLHYACLVYSWLLGYQYCNELLKNLKYFWRRLWFLVWQTLKYILSMLEWKPDLYTTVYQAKTSIWKKIFIVYRTYFVASSCKYHLKKILFRNEWIRESKQMIQTLTGSKRCIKWLHPWPSFPFKHLKPSYDHWFNLFSFLVN